MYLVQAEDLLNTFAQPRVEFFQNNSNNILVLLVVPTKWSGGAEDG